VTIIAKDETNGHPSTPGGPVTAGSHEEGSGCPGEEVVRLGDEHVSGVETLCVGESQ